MFALLSTVSALLKGRRSIKLWGFFSGGILEFSQFLPEKAPKSGLLEQTSHCTCEDVLPEKICAKQMGAWFW